MFNSNVRRIGFCCKYMHPDQSLKPKVLKEIQGSYNSRSTTLSWLRNQSKRVAESRLQDIASHNLSSGLKLVDYVSSLPQGRRMVRLTSDFLPGYTSPEWKDFWQSEEMRSFCAEGFSKIGEVAREKDVRLSFHPGQFTVLASHTPQIVENSIEEFEYHAQMARWMGYGKTFQDFKINVHISGRQGPEGIRRILPRLSPEARNTITIENDEMCWGLDASLELADDLALVLDIHHHWVRTGEYIQPEDPRFQRVIESWRGVRPAIHYSVSRESVLTEHSGETLPHLDSLLENGFNQQKLRGHSDRYWNRASNEWALRFLPYADIQCEAKHKNLASQELYELSLGKTSLKEISQ